MNFRTLAMIGLVMLAIGFSMTHGLAESDKPTQTPIPIKDQAERGNSSHAFDVREERSSLPVNTNAILHVTVFKSKSQKNNDGVEVYPIEYTIINPTNKDMFIFFYETVHLRALYFDLLKPNGFLERIYPGYEGMADGSQKRPPVVRQGETMTFTDEIPATIFSHNPNDGNLNISLLMYLYNISDSNKKPNCQVVEAAPPCYK